jgi:hypothetical protein
VISSSGAREGLLDEGTTKLGRNYGTRRFVENNSPVLEEMSIRGYLQMTMETRF